MKQKINKGGKNKTSNCVNVPTSDHHHLSGNVMRQAIKRTKTDNLGHSRSSLKAAQT